MKINEKAKFKFELGNIGKKKCVRRNVKKFNIHTAVNIFIFASPKFKFGNTVNSTKSNFKEEELEADLCRCLQTFFKNGALKNFSNFLGKHLCWMEALLIKSQA